MCNVNETGEINCQIIKNARTDDKKIEGHGPLSQRCVGAASRRINKNARTCNKEIVGHGPLT